MPLSSLLLNNFTSLASSLLSELHTFNHSINRYTFSSEPCNTPSPTEWSRIYQPFVIHFQTKPSPLLSLLSEQHTITRHIHRLSPCMALHFLFYLTIPFYHPILSGWSTYNHTRYTRHVKPVSYFTHSHTYWLNKQLRYDMYPLHDGLPREHNSNNIW